MKIYNEISDLSDFSPWSGAVETYNRIIEAGKGEFFIAMLEDVYPDGMTDTELNDLLWFDPAFCLDLVGLQSEDEDEEEDEEEDENEEKSEE